MAIDVAESTVVLAVTEPTPGTEQVPSASTNAMLVFDNGNVAQPTVDMIPKRPLRTSHTLLKRGVGARASTFTIPTVLMSRGNSNGSPWLKPLLQAAGLAETYTESVGSPFYNRATYAPISSAFRSATIYSYQGNKLHKGIGCLGTFELNMVAGAMPDLTFTFQSKYSAVTTVTNPTPTLPTNTMTMVEDEALTIGSYTPVCRSMRLTHGNNVVRRLDVNASKALKGFHISAREPILELQIECEDTLANKDFFAYLEAQAAFDDAAMDDITFHHGTGVQSAIVFTATAPFLVDEPRYDTVDGLRMYTLRYLLTSTTDDGEYTIEFREDQP